MKEIKTTQALGQLMRQARKSQGLTQEQLASISGTGRRFVLDLSQLERSIKGHAHLELCSRLVFAVDRNLGPHRFATEQ